MGIADEVADRQGEGLSAFKHDGIRIDGANTHFRARQVSHDGHPAAGFGAGGADVLDDLAMGRCIAVREVDAGDVHASHDQLFQHLR